MTRYTSERGAVLVQVAIAILVLTAMATFVVDHGILWLSRGQAQNAADAGALSGAIARAYDELTSPPASNGKAFNSAMGAALANNVWTSSPTAQVSWVCPTGVAGSCVRVDVYRNGEFGSTPLPTIFGKLLNISSQGVRATATARVATGNATNCMRPFAVVDRWNDIVDPSLTPPEFQRWDTQGGNAGTELNPKDIYTPPSAGSAGTGYTVSQHLGTQVILKTGNNPNSVAGSVGPGWSLPVRLPDGNGGNVSGASDFQNAIKAYRRSLTLQPDNPLVPTNLANVYDAVGATYFNAGDWGKALSNFTEASTYAPASARIMTHIGSVYVNTGNLPKAIEYYKKALSIDPANAEARQHLAHIEAPARR